MCLAFGVERLDEVARASRDVLELQPPQGIADKLRALGKLKSLADSRAKTSRSGAVPGVVLGDEPDLDRLPILTCWPGDGGPFITLPLVFTQGPAHRRPQRRHVPAAEVSTRTSTGLHWQIHKDAAADWREGASGRMEVAVALGTDPIDDLRRLVPAAKHIDELMVAGFLRGDRVEIVQCKTVDLEVPAHAEIVLEGYCERGELGDEGPFGDHTGYYTPVDAVPGLARDRMTHRARRDLPVHRRRPAAGRGRLAGQGHRAHLPARAAHDLPRDRRLRPAGRRAPSTTAASSRSARLTRGTRAR